MDLITKEVLRSKVNMGGDFVLADVRSPEDFRSEHIKGAISLPLENMEREIAKHHLDKAKETIVYCGGEGCNASSEGAERLSKIGFSKTERYEGGIKEWEKAGFPVEINVPCSCS
ncbi:MAG: rhodanese-like domain-containing protein [Candidatus Omnitrophica bacterium]|nr:rhodanese-like domain-containing protein [Candidatus Omnitrophota bacterium]